MNLAGALHGEAGDAIKHDQSLAAELAQILDDEIRGGSLEEGPINMQISFACRWGELQRIRYRPAGAVEGGRRAAWGCGNRHHGLRCRAWVRCAATHAEGRPATARSAIDPHADRGL